MTTPNNANDDGGTGDNSNVTQMREAINRKDQRIKELETRVSSLTNSALSGLAHQAGYDPTTGPVKLVMEKFQQDLTDDKLDPEAFTSFAKEWGIEPSPTATTPPQGQQQPGQPVPPQGTEQSPAQQGLDPQAAATQQQIQQFQTPADQLQAAAQANANPPAGSQQDVAVQIQSAESEGRWGDSFALKVASAPAPPDGFGNQQGTGVNAQTGLPTHTPSS